jgi:hypothetical protein
MKLKDAEIGSPPYEILEDGRAIVRVKVSRDIQKLYPRMIPVFVFEESAFGFLAPSTEVRRISKIVID